jgi:hypothetical protein
MEELPPIDMEMVRLCLSLQDFMPFGDPLPAPLDKKITRGGGSTLKPHFFLAEGNGNVYISIRGAAEPGDFAICLDFERENFCSGKVHRGVLSASRWIIEQCMPYISKCTGSIVCTGHSFGGALSSMIAAILGIEQGRKNVYAVSMAPFPIFSRDFAERTKPFIVSFVYNNDVVPRLNSKTIASIVNMFCPPGPNQQSGVMMVQGMIQQMFTGIMQQSGYATQQGFAELGKKIPDLVNRLIEMGSRPEPVEFYMPGRCFHIVTTPEGDVSFTPYVDGNGFIFATLMVGLMDHSTENYIDNIMCWDGPDE